MTHSVSIGFDGRVMELAFVKKIEEELKTIPGITININPTLDLVGKIWTDRPKLLFNEIYILPIEFSGKEAADKLNEVRLALREKQADYHLISSLDDIAWLLNLRGSDIASNPVFLSFLFISEDSAVLFCHIESISDEIRDYLEELGISLGNYDDIYDFLRSYKEKDGSGENGENKETVPLILLDPDTINYRLYSEACKSFAPLLEENPSGLMKSMKNETEIENLRAANITDGIAMVRFLKWIDDYRKYSDFEDITEMMVVKKLLEFRRLSPDFIDTSFETIAAYGSHGAIVHYEPTAETDITIDREGFLLVDSGAQYLKGTTDITRTIVMGEL